MVTKIKIAQWASHKMHEEYHAGISNKALDMLACADFNPDDLTVRSLAGVIDDISFIKDGADALTASLLVQNQLVKILGPTKAGADLLKTLAITEFGLGSRFNNRKMITQGLQHINLAISGHSSKVLLTYKGAMHFALNEYQEALHIFREVHDEVMMGKCFYYLKEYEEAVEHLTRTPSQESSINSIIGNSLVKLDRHVEAIPFYEASIALGNCESGNLSHAGACYLKAGQFKKALIYLEESVRLGNTDTEMYRRMALCHGHLFQLDDAVYCLERAVELALRSDFKRSNIEKLDGAVKDAQKLIELGLDSFWFLEHEKMYSILEHALEKLYHYWSTKQLLFTDGAV